MFSNRGVAFMGDTKGGAFDVPAELARKWLDLPPNPNGRSNADVLQPWRNGMDLTRRSADKWIIDFGWEMDEEAAAMYEAPFTHVLEQVRPVRAANRRDHYRKFWWRHVEPRPGMWRALKGLSRYIATPTVAKHRVMVWLDASICPDHQLIAIARDDDTSFGILHSRFHELWSLRSGTWLGVGNDPRYTPSTTFETFPFPDGLTPDVSAANYLDDPRAQTIARAACQLDMQRRRWLDPSDLTGPKPEEFSNSSERTLLPYGSTAAAELKTRTLTNLYNKRPTWLANAHRRLDVAVAHAYGWSADITDEGALTNLLQLNAARAEQDQKNLLRQLQAQEAEKVRQSPPLKLPIPGGRAKNAKRPSDEPVLETPRELRRKGRSV
jgi:type II restriction/modification system DNA methylase subunit YeeA